MKFDKSFRGYNVTQVDNYLKAQQERFDQVSTTQKQRIFQLSNENDQLKAQLKQYQLDEKAIKDSLVESQKLAIQLKDDAEKYSRVVLKRAKLFYATWQAYAKTMLNAFSPEEMSQFNSLMKKIEELIADFGEQEKQSQQQVAPNAQAGVSTMQTEDMPLSNPVQKVANATQPAIDLAELLKPDQSLEEMCTDLGLI